MEYHELRDSLKINTIIFSDQIIKKIVPYNIILLNNTKYIFSFH